MYAKFWKRLIDFTLSILGLVILSPILLLLVIIGAVKMKGNPFFVQLRPGLVDPKTGQERIFKLIKLRTMTNEKDKDGKLLPDEKRLTAYGRFLRSTSADELFELVNIIKGDMSIVGPRPQLVRDMVFMSEEQRKRHSVRPGLTGLAQVSGRNFIAWDDRLAKDVEYVENLSFMMDVKILIKTVAVVFKKDDVAVETDSVEGFLWDERKVREDD